MYKIFIIFALFISNYADASCKVLTPLYGGNTGCYASGPSSDFPNIYIEGFVPYSLGETGSIGNVFNRTVGLYKEIKEKCIGNVCTVIHPIVYSCEAIIPVEYRYTIKESCLSSASQSPQNCNVSPPDRNEGGWKGITFSQCTNRGMCFDSSIQNATWCYIPAGRCNINPNNREDGGWPGISKNDCERLGMCFNDSIKASKWCYKPLGSIF